MNPSDIVDDQGNQRSRSNSSLSSSVSSGSTPSSRSSRRRSGFFMHTPQPERDDEDQSFEWVTKFTFLEDEERWIGQKTRIKLEETAFHEGRNRVFHQMWEKKDNTESKMVAKLWKDDSRVRNCFDEAMPQLMVNDLARKFNVVGGFSRKVSFLPVFIYRLHERGGQLITAEPYLEGKFIKHNDCNGHTGTEDVVPQAFSHFSWEASARTLLVCNIQGVGDVWTDPSFQTTCSGNAAVCTFFSTHQCTDLCRAHGLTQPSELPAPEEKDSKRGNRGLWAASKAWISGLSRGRKRVCGDAHIRKVAVL